jgi:hypothetical protein
MSRRTRRDVVVSAGSVLAGVGGLAATAAPSAAEIDSDAKPDHVSITYDEERLERWQPYMSVSIDASNSLTGVYGYEATSPEWEYDVLCYWARYAVQEGWLSWDSHQYDHEPVYLYLDSAASEPAPPSALEIVKYAAYHHYSGSFAPTSADLAGSRQSDAETHISLDVRDPHHQYSRAEAGTGVHPTLRSWPAARPEWESYGFYENTSREAVDNPISMLDRESWWADGTLDARIAGLWLRLGLAPDDVDDLDREA